MANKKISELESRASLSLSDLMAVGDPSTGYLYKTTISDLKTLTGAGVVSFNGRFGTVNPAEGDYTLTQLGDVIITSATNGQVLQYNGSNWVNSSLNLTTTLAALTDVAISSIANNQLLRYNSTSQKWENWTPNYLTAESDTLNSVTGRGNTTANSITVGSVTAAGLSNLLGEIRTFATTGNIYMGANPGSATDAGFRLDVLGTTRLNGNTTVTGVLTGSDTIRSTNGTVTVSLSYGSTAGIIGTTSNHSLELRTNNTYRVGVSTAGVVNIANLIGTGSRMVVADAAGNLSTQAIPTSAVSSVFGRTGAVVAANGDYTTSQVTEGTNLYYTDARARAAITLTTTGSSGAATYSGGTLNIPTYTLAGLGGQPALSGTGFVKISGTTISYDNSTYLTTSSAASTYLPLSGGTLTGSLLVNAENTYIAIDAQSTPRLGFVKKSGSQPFLAFASDPFSIRVSSGTDVSASNTFVTALSIATTGAATFSSSVTAGGNMLVPAGSGIAWSGDSSRIMTPEDNVSGALIQTPGIIRFNAGGSEKARITSAGNFGIGTTSPATNLHIASVGMTLSSTTTYSSSTTKGITLEATNGATDVGNGIWFNSGQLYSGIAGVRSSSANWGTDLRFFTHPDSTTNQLDLTERMRITSGGNAQYTGDPFIYSNTTAGGTAIHAGLRFHSTDKYIRFFTNDLGRMDITSNGNIGIGTSNPGGILEARAGSGANFRVRNNGTNVLLLQNYNDTDNYRNFQIAASTIQFLTSSQGATGATETARFSEIGNLEIATGSIKTGEPDTGWGRAAIKIGASVSGAAFNVTRYLPVSVDGTIYYINLNSSTP